jgi:hypothetical protein
MPYALDPAYVRTIAPDDCPERQLCAAIILQALEDARTVSHPYLALDARRWLLASPDVSLFAEALGMDATTLRTRLCAAVEDAPTDGRRHVPPRGSRHQAAVEALLAENPRLPNYENAQILGIGRVTAARCKKRARQLKKETSV